MTQNENENTQKETMARLMNIILENYDTETTPMEQIINYIPKNKMPGYFYLHSDEIDRVESIKGSNMYMVVRTRPKYKNKKTL